MSLEKARLKAAVVAGLGQSLEARVETTKVDKIRREGARAACIDAAQKLNGYMAGIDKTCEEAGLGLEEMKVVKTVARQMYGIVDNLAVGHQIGIHKAEGAHEEANRSAEANHKLWQELIARVEALEAAEGQDPDPDKARPEGSRPPPSIAARRKAAAEKKAKAASDEPTDTDIEAAVQAVQQDSVEVQSSAPTPDGEPKPKPKPKRRTRRKSPPKE